jgi:hypothetical protein
MKLIGNMGASLKNGTNHQQNEFTPAPTTKNIPSMKMSQ